MSLTSSDASGWNVISGIVWVSARRSKFGPGHPVDLSVQQLVSPSGHFFIRYLVVRDFQTIEDEDCKFGALPFRQRR